MRMYDLILKKRSGEALSKEEIDFIIQGYTKGEIPDYQISALLMAMFLKGLDKEETFDLTRAMKDSGETLDLSSIKGIKVDKRRMTLPDPSVILKLENVGNPLIILAPLVTGPSFCH